MGRTDPYSSPVRLRRFDPPLISLSVRFRDCYGPSRGAPGGLRAGAVRGPIQPVTLHLAIQRREMDAQRLRRARLVAIHLLENPLDVLAFQFLEGQPRAVDARDGGGR